MQCVCVCLFFFLLLKCSSCELFCSSGTSSQSAAPYCSLPVISWRLEHYLTVFPLGSNQLSYPGMKCRHVRVSAGGADFRQLGRKMTEVILDFRWYFVVLKGGKKSFLSDAIFKILEWFSRIVHLSEGFCNKNPRRLTIQK